MRGKNFREWKLKEIKEFALEDLPHCLEGFLYMMQSFLKGCGRNTAECSLKPGKTIYNLMLGRGVGAINEPTRVFYKDGRLRQITIGMAEASKIGYNYIAHELVSHALREMRK